MGKLVALVLGLAALALLAVGLSIAIALLVRLSGWLWSKVCR